MRLFNLILICTLVSTAMFGQLEVDMKSADKNLKKYYLDPASNAEALATAVASIDKVMEYDGAMSNGEALLLKGKIYNELANADFKAKFLDPAHELVNPEAAAISSKALIAAYGLAEKKAGQREALNALVEAEELLNNMAIYSYSDGNYNNAYINFKSSLDASNFIKEQGSTSRITSDSMYNEQLFYTAVCGYSGDMKAESKPFLMELYNKKYKETFIYDALFNLANEAGEADALKYLEEGRKVNPEDTSLLFSEINYYLKKGELTTLTDKLKMAIAAEPDNVTVYTTTGSVYDQLSVQSRDSGDNAKADEYFNDALDYYNQALSRDAENFDVNYSIGQLYYNKAATMVTDINKLGDDITNAGIAKYNAKKAEMDGVFKQALPYFISAEKLDGNDINTVIALKEIYARLGELEKSKQYKVKYDELSK